MSKSKEEHGNYSKYDECRECDHVASPCEPAFHGVCNSCGSEQVGKVIGRWWFVWESGFISAHRRNTRFERVGDT